MLPNLPRKIVPLVTAAALALGAAAPAQALGKNERNVLKGVAAAVIVQQLIQHANRGVAQPAYQSPAYQTPRDYRPSHQPPAYRPADSYGTPGRVIGRDAPVRQVQHSAAEAVFRDYGPQGRREIQRRLASYGYYQGAIDGVWGRGTAAAVERYARDIRAAEQLRHQRGALEVYQGLLS